MVAPHLYPHRQRQRQRQRQRPAGAGPYRPFVGAGGVVCWLAGSTWRPLNMAGLRAEPQDIWAVEVTRGRALFFTATDSYVRGTIVNGAGDISGWHRFFERADGYPSGFNIHKRQSVRAVATNPDAIELYAVGLDEVVWYRPVAVSAFTRAGGWRTLLDTQTFPGDGGRFYMPQSLTALYDGRIMARAKDNATYETCYASSVQFRWVRMGFACPPFIPGPR